MKIVLSRKGFDSSNGGIVSPIFEDGTMISFPIPSDDKDNFNDLVFKKYSYSHILSNLKYKGKINCHIDPDLDNSLRVNPLPNWKAIFGQIDSSALYLRNNVKIEIGDIFLFFGNFHAVKEENGKIHYIRNSNDFYKDNDLQVIWGYLQVGEIITSPEKQKLFIWHPHSIDKRTIKKSNTMFLASDKLSFNKNMKGAGLLKYDEKRVLTLYGASKATWKKNSVYDVNSIIGNRKNNAKDKQKGIYYQGIWQELGLKESSVCEDWAKSIIM